MSVARRVVTKAISLSPRRRRWQRLLTNLTLDPDHLTSPVTPPDPRDFIICGLPRSGTSLATAALYQPPRVVTVMEPWDGMRLAPAELFSSLRAEIGTGTLTRGRLDGALLLADGRVEWCRDGEKPSAIHVAPDYLLGVKWPAFWRYLDLLPDTKFIVCVRHPLEVLASFRSTRGRLARGLEYDLAFNRRMNDELLSATDDPVIRQVLLMDAVARGLAPHLDRPNVFTLRYERWFDDPNALLEGLTAFLGVDVTPTPVVVAQRPSRTDDASLVDMIRRHSAAPALLGYDLG
ncbi:MAG: hypothetical protein QOD92_3779 [Acidimicrobiaceae bacterium]|jgi:hypothetical protein